MVSPASTRVLVTGGAGFIGSAIVDLLVAEGYDVSVLDCLHPSAHRYRPEYLNPGARYTIADLRDPDEARAAVHGIDVVFHQAAMVGLGVDFGDVNDYVANNDVATAVLLEALHRRSFTGRLVLASSMVVYGEGRYRCGIHGIVTPGARSVGALEAGEFEPVCPLCGGPLVAEVVPESAPTDPRNVYAATKLLQEHLCGAYAREHSGSAIALRYHNVYGPRMPRNTPYAGVASIFRSAAERGEPARVFEDGGQTRDFVHVGDVARANLAAIQVPEDVNGSFNVCSGTPHTILEMAEALRSSFPGTPAPEVVGGYRLGDVRHVFADPSAARDALSFDAAVTFGEGMAEFAVAPLRR